MNDIVNIQFTVPYRLTPEEVLKEIMDQTYTEGGYIVSAVLLGNDGFGHLIPVEESRIP